MATEQLKAALKIVQEKGEAFYQKSRLDSQEDLTRD